MRRKGFNWQSSEAMKHPSTRRCQGKKTQPNFRIKVGHFIKRITYCGWCSKSYPWLTIPTELQDNIHKSIFRVCTALPLCLKSVHANGTVSSKAVGAKITLSLYHFCFYIFIFIITFCILFKANSFKNTPSSAFKLNTRYVLLTLAAGINCNTVNLLWKSHPFYLLS